MVRGDEVHLVGHDLLPQRRTLVGRADGRVLLEPGAHLQHLALLEHQVLHAGLGGGGHAFLPVALRLLDAARERAVHDVAAHAGHARDLEDSGIGHHLGDRRAAGAVALRRVAALVEKALGEAADDGGVSL